MAHPLSAYFGRDTYAFLARCAKCGRPYDGRDLWHTVKGGTARTDIWWLVCPECHKEVDE